MNERGFSLVEVLVTVVIVGIAFTVFVAGMGAAMVGSDFHRKQAVVQASIRNLAESVKAADYVDCAVPSSYGPTAQSGATGTPSPTAPSVRTLDTGGQLLTFFGLASSGSFTQPTGMTEHYDDASSGSSSAVTAAMYDQALTDSGATGPRTASAVPAGDVVAQSVALDSAHTPAGIALVGATHANSTTNSLTLSVPSGAASSSVVLAQVVVRGDSTATITPPAGWTLLMSGSANNTVRSLLFRRISGTTATPRWTLSTARETAGGVVAYSGTSPYTTSVTGIKYWNGTSYVTTACTTDQGLQLVSLHANSADNRGALDVDVVKRRP